MSILKIENHTHHFNCFDFQTKCDVFLCRFDYYVCYAYARPRCSNFVVVVSFWLFSSLEKFPYCMVASIYIQYLSVYHKVVDEFFVVGFLYISLLITVSRCGLSLLMM